MTDQLQWTRKDDWTQAGSIRGRDLYHVKRQLNFDRHPATSYEYLPKCIADPDRVIGAGKYDDSKFARAACQEDLDQQQRRAAASTQGDSK